MDSVPHLVVICSREKPMFYLSPNPSRSCVLHAVSMDEWVKEQNPPCKGSSGKCSFITNTLMFTEKKVHE